MKFQHVMFKAPRSRCTQEWTVYPHSEGDDQLLIQSSTRIARIFLRNKVMQISPPVASGACSIHLTGAPLIDCPEELLEQLKVLPATGNEVRIL